MEQSKGRLALAEAMQLHNEREAAAQRRVHDLVNQLEDARQELEAVARGKRQFVESMRGSHRVRSRQAHTPLRTERQKATRAWRG